MRDGDGGRAEIRGPLFPGWVTRTWCGGLAATFKRELVASAAEMRRLKDRVQQLQNELIQVGMQGTPEGQGGSSRQSITAPA